MDTMVSARVPVEIKKQGDAQLKIIGSSVTELVNSAYGYLLEHGTLPKASASELSEGPQSKVLSGDAARAFKERWGERCVLDAPGYDGANFKELLDDARSERYARFA